MSFTHALSTNNYGPSRIIIDPNPANGTHTDFTSAIAAASAGDVIIIRPATYVEAFTVTKNLTFFAFDSSFRGGERVTLSGKITISANDLNVGFSGIGFDTNADNSFLLSGSTCFVTCENCFFNADAATSINITALSNFHIINCSGTIGNGVALFTTTTGLVWIIDSLFIDVTGTPSASTTSTGACRIFNSSLTFPISTSSTGAFIILNSNFGGQQNPQTNTTWVTTAGTGTSFIDNSTFNSGTASAISIGAGTTVIASGLRVSSSNTNAITGAGTIQYGSIDFSGSSSTINTTTQTALITQLGSLNIKTPISLTAPVPLMRDSVTGAVGVGSASGLTWTDITGATQTLAVQNGYITDRGAGVTYTLPATASLGDVIKIDGKLGITSIAQNANQAIRVTSSISTTGVGGSVVGTNLGDCITLRCTTAGASTIWIAENFTGNWTVT